MAERKGSALLSNALRRVAAFPLWAKILLALAALGVLGLSVLLSPLVVVLALLALIVAVFALIIRLLRRRPLRRWGIIVATSAVVLLVFTSISNALYFGGQPEQATSPDPERGTATSESTPKPLEQAEKQKGAEQIDEKQENPDKSLEEPEKDNSPTSTAGASASADDEFAGPTVTVKRAIDGDTIEISPAVDGEDMVRLIGIDAPEERSQECGAQPLAQEATDQAALWEDLEVKLEFDEDRTDQYGRLLAYVHEPVTDDMMNVDMIDSGYAQVYIVPPNTKHEDELRKAQKEAKELSLGYGLDIWSLPPAKDAQLADYGNGIGQGDGACPPKAQPKPQPTASATASPNASPNRDYNIPDSNATATAPSTASPSTGDINCDQVNGPIRVGPNDPHNLDGNNDGWACEE